MNQKIKREYLKHKIVTQENITKCNKKKIKKSVDSSIRKQTSRKEKV
jgi:hypothetical protein